MDRRMLSFLVGFTLILWGCTEELDPEPQAATPVAEETSDPGGGYGRQGAGSALGKAKESARGTAEAMQQRSAEVAEESDEPE